VRLFRFDTDRLQFRACKARFFRGRELVDDVLQLDDGLGLPAEFEQGLALLSRAPAAVSLAGPCLSSFSKSAIAST
jgi:hypothetical protein